MQARFNLNTSEFSRALREYQSESGRTAVDVINKAARDILLDRSYGMIKGLPKATVASINEDMRRDNLGLKIAAKELAGTQGAVRANPAARTQSGRLKKRSTWQKRVGNRTRINTGRRRSAISFLRIPWMQAASKLRGKSPSVSRAGGRGWRDMGDAQKATDRSLAAVLEAAYDQKDAVRVNRVGRLAAEQLQKAIRGTTRAFQRRLQREIAKNAERHSAR